MIEIVPGHLVLLAIVALVVIGPKDLPKALRVVGHWVGRARGISRQFRAGFDNMVREAELAEMEKKWAAENERIMKEHGAGAEAADPADDARGPSQAEPAGADREPVTVEQPHLVPAPVGTPAHRPDDAMS